MPLLPAPSLRDTELFTRLQELGQARRCPLALPGNVLDICNEAAARLKLFPVVHTQFTLHDETHCLRVVQLMASVASGVVGQLNGVELALLILAAYHHDQGMIVEAPELSAIRSSTAWKIHEQDWAADYPNYREAADRASDAGATPAERDRAAGVANDLRAAMWTDFIRRTHGRRSAQFVSDTYRDDRRLNVNSRSLADLLATICESHVRPPDTITASNGYAFDELVGTDRVNVALLAYILRLADILDFDRERTPVALYRAISFTSATSVTEWQKHLSIVGWSVDLDRIVFSAECEHPAYERAIRHFMDDIDAELASVQEWNRNLPSAFQPYALNLPVRVDRDRIGPRIDPVARTASYKYQDLEFSLSRDEIVKLLMTDGLYQNRSLFIRELLQNALDALRYRKALYQLDDMVIPTLSVGFEHIQELGVDIVRCIDNGSGMDEEIVSQFLTRAGRSYYRSPAFERERARFRSHRCDFDPCARFGIGFMSCFMFGDEIKIRTRRDYGAGRERGRPLEIEITGLSGLVVIRPGSENQPVGTTVEIRGRRRSFPIDWWSDPVHLVGVLEGYALGADFPITADCRVPGFSRRTVIEPGFTVLPDPLEGSAISRKTTYTGSFAAADQRLQGEVRVSTLVDSVGIPTVANEEASIKVAGNPAQRVITASDGSSIAFGPSDLDDSQQLCCDGILVAGPPGRLDTSDRLRDRLGHRSLHDGFGGAAFLLDARGDLKPMLTPARTPPDDLHHRTEPSWRRLFDAAAPAYSNVLCDIVNECARAGNPDRFWLVAEGYGLALSRLPLAKVFAHLDFPFATTGSDEVQWRSLRTMGRLQLRLPNDDRNVVGLIASDGAVLAIPPAIRELAVNHGTVSVWSLAYIIAGCSVVGGNSSNVIELTPDAARADATLSDLTTGGGYEKRYLFRFANMKDVVSICGRGGFANLDHPITQYYRATAENKRWEERSPLERLTARLVWSVVGNSFELPPAASDTRIRKELATLYRAIDWRAVEPSLRPPFHVFRQGHGIDDLTDAHFDSWNSLTVPTDDY